MVVVTMVGRASTAAYVVVDDVLDLAEVLYMARNGDSSLVIKPVFLLCFLEQAKEEGVGKGHHRNYELLFLLATDTNHHR